MTSTDFANDFQASSAGRAEVLADMRKWLELDKLTVIRGGWKLPETFERARKEYYEDTTSWHWEKENEPRYKAIKAAFDEQLALASDSLRNFIAQQDKEIAQTLSPDDLHSLLRLGHVTLRGASTQPVSAVVVFDPIEGGDAPDRDWALKQLVNSGKFADAWSEDKGAEAIEKLRVADFIENFDINPLDLYAYQVLLRVHYALRHENQLVNMHGRLDEEKTKPHHLSFASQAEYDYPREYKPYHGQQEYKAVEQTNAEVASFLYLDRYDNREASRKPAFGRDQDFYAKLVRLEAIDSIFPILFGEGAKTVLRRFAGEPNRGWMHYYPKAGEEIAREGLSPEQTESIAKEFTEKLIGILKENRPEEENQHINIFARVFDLRVLVPAFRKLYESDESKGTARAFLNIINEGLQRYFPTLLASPMPGWTKESEPPKTISDYQRPQSAPAAKRPSTPTGPT